MKPGLLTYTNKGLYCPAGGFYIDPSSKVDKALITHSHSDHAVRGHESYLAHYYNIPILKTRISPNINIQGVEYGEILNINGIKISFFPSGHVIGSSQIKLENKYQRIVITGDYKIENDNFCNPFIPIECDTFITETTFAQPLYRWEAQNKIFNEMSKWIKENKTRNLYSVILCYSLGKAQRIIKNISLNGTIYVNEPIFKINQSIESSGIKMPPYKLLVDFNQLKPGDLLLASHSFLNNSGIPRNAYSLAEASGWMKLYSPKHLDKKFILSDHADWNGLNYAVKQSKASKIYTTHGFTKTYTHWLRKKGYEAYDIEDLRF